MNGSWLTPSTAGMESSANIRSVVSTTSSTRNSGVTWSRPVLRTTKRSSGAGSATGSTRRAKRQHRVVPRVGLGLVLPGRGAA